MLILLAKISWIVCCAGVKRQLVSEQTRSTALTSRSWLLLHHADIFGVACCVSGEYLLSIKGVFICNFSLVDILCQRGELLCQVQIDPIQKVCPRLSPAFDYLMLTKY